MSFFALDVLPALNEGDERISLADILSCRDAALSQEEICAVCCECCISLKNVHNSSEMFHTLCITPETLAFDSQGNVCFLDLYTDPELLYVPPEYENIGNSNTAHMYSLGMTLVYAAEYNSSEYGTSQLSDRVNDLLTHMTEEEYEERADINTVIKECRCQLGDVSTEEVCRVLVTTGKDDLSSFGSTESLNSSTSPVISTEQPHDNNLITTSNDAQKDVQRLKQMILSPLKSNDFTSNVRDKLSAPAKRKHVNCGKIDLEYNTQLDLDEMLMVENNSQENVTLPILDSNSHDNTEILLENSSANLGSTCKLIPDMEKSDDSGFTSLLESTGGETLNENSMDLNKAERVLNSMDGRTIELTSGQIQEDKINGHEREDFTASSCVECGNDTHISQEGSLHAHSAENCHVITDCMVVYGSEIETHTVSPYQGVNNESMQFNSDVRFVGGEHDLSRNTDNRCERDGDRYRDCARRVQADICTENSSRQETGRLSPMKPEKVAVILDQLGYGLQENELWGLCQECLLALRECKDHLPCYIALETVEVQADGSVQFLPHTDVTDMKSAYLAPEFQSQPISTEKTCIFGVAAMLWYAADYKMPESQEPVLSTEMEKLLMSMTHEDCQNRPEITQVLKVCSRYLSQHRLLSSTVCKSLLQEANKASTFGRNNVLVKDILADSHKQLVETQKKSVLESIRNSKIKLKSAALNTQPCGPPVETFHEKLMKEIRSPNKKLRQISKVEDSKDTMTVQQETSPNKLFTFSAFTAVKNTEKSALKGDIPEAFHSEATHFKPIVISGTKIKSPLNQTKTGSPKVKLAKNNQKVDLKIEELKKNLMKNKQAVTIAKDVEKDLQLDESTETFAEKKNPITGGTCQYHANKTGFNQSLNLNLPFIQDVHRMTSPYSYQPGFGPTVTSPNFYPVPVQLVTDPQTGTVQYLPVTYPTMPLSLPPNQNGFNMFSISSPVTSVESDSDYNRRHSLPNSVFNSSLREMQGKNDCNTRPKSAERPISKPRKRIKRAKSGSSLDFKSYDVTHTIDIDKPTLNLQAIDLEIPAAKTVYKTPPKPKLYDTENTDSIEISPRSGTTVSPAISPQLSKDSGFCAPKLSRLSGIKSGGAATLMDKLLSTESMGHQKVVGHVVSLIREEFAFDGYMENGIEDLAIAEYIVSLADLKFETFSSAVTEKYSDLYWQDDLLEQLYEAVNGRKPTVRQKNHSQNATSLYPNNENNEISHLYRKNPGRQTKDAMKTRSLALYTDSDSTDTETREMKTTAERYPTGLTNTSKTRSSSLHNITFITGSNTCDDSAGRDKSLTSTNSPKLIVVRSLEDGYTLSNIVHTSPTLARSNDDCNSTDPNVCISPVRKRNSVSHILTVKRCLKSAKSESFLNQLEERDRADHGYGSSSKVKRTGHGFNSSSSVIYYWKENIYTTTVKEMFFNINLSCQGEVERKMNDLKQQYKMEEKQRIKTCSFYQRLLEASKNTKVANEQKNLISKMQIQKRECDQRLNLLRKALQYTQIQYSELWGLDQQFLPSLCSLASSSTLFLTPSDPADNPNLTFHVPSSRPDLTFHVPSSRPDAVTGGGIQAGTPTGLVSFLYARDAVRSGYIHQFLYGFRYFISAGDLLNFIQDRFTASLLAPITSHDSMKVRSRSLDLLFAWLEGYYVVDFKFEPELTSAAETFIKTKILPADPVGEELLHLIWRSKTGKSPGLPKEIMHGSERSKDSQLPKKWETFRAALHLTSKPLRVGSTKPLVTCVERRPQHLDEAVYCPKVSRKEDMFALNDYMAQSLAQQLTLIQQELFHRCHPVHLLNSRSQGIDVALSQPTISSKSPSLHRLDTAWDDQGGVNLFVQPSPCDDVIKRMIQHGHQVSHWVTAEVVTCTSTKSQLAVVIKFIYTAKICHEMRNYASCVAIVDGLENIIVRQLPIWMRLPSKCVSLMEELSSVKVFLKSDSLCVYDEACRGRPTIPAILLLLLHVQQAEIGSFTLANGTFKWAKIKNIAEIIDQVRVFQQHRYQFTPDSQTQEMIQERIHKFKDSDLQMIAAQNNVNVQKISGKFFHNAFQRFRGRFRRGSDT